MPRKRPRIARLDQVRISRDGEHAMIEFHDFGLATTHLRIGPQVHQMTDAEILLVFNQTLTAQIRYRDELGEYVAIEVPVGSPQVAYHPGMIHNSRIRRSFRSFKHRTSDNTSFLVSQKYRSLVMSRSRKTTRREFLASSSATTGAAFAAAYGATFIPASALGRDGHTAPSERVRMGFIGCGRQCYHKNIPLFVRTGDVQAMAVCDVDSWRSENAVRQIETQYTSGRAKGTFTKVDQHLDYQDLLARDDIDAVMISTPDHWHCTMALDAMQAGKDVALEKPITRTIREGQHLVKAAAEHQRVFRVDSEFRSGEPAHRATTLVRNGYIGKVRRVTACVPESDIPCPPQPDMPVPAGFDYQRWQGPAPRAPYTLNRVHTPKSYERPGWMRHLYYCDGMITNWGTHLNNGAMWATDTERTGPVEIEATGQYPEPNSFWNVLLKFQIKYKFTDGLEWIYRTEKPYFLIEGDEGWVRAGFSEFDAEPKSLLTLNLEKIEQKFPLQGEKENFIAGVRSRQDTLEPAEVGHRVTSLGLLGHIAIHTGRKLQWDPAEEVFVNDDAANKYLDTPILHRPQVG